MDNHAESNVAAFDDLLRGRRSCRRFSQEVPPTGLVDKVVEAGLLAPTGRNRQSTVVVRVDDKGFKAEITAKNAEIMGAPPSPDRGPDPFYGAPVMLLVIAQKCDTDVYDGSLALGNMMLKAHELGLGSCWIHRAKPEMESPLGAKILSRLGLEGEWIGVGHLALGYPQGPLPEAKAIREGRYLVL